MSATAPALLGGGGWEVSTGAQGRDEHRPPPLGHFLKSEGASMRPPQGRS